MGNKSIAKASGLKSTFKIDDDKYFMTSFGRGNAAQAEKDLENGKVTDLNNTFSARYKDRQSVVIAKGALQADVQLPATDHNQLQAKDVIEKMYFGQSFPDNIHIQIAYNVMDIKKVLSVYTNIIVYAVNNLLRINPKDDFLGMFSTMNNLKAAAVASAIESVQLIRPSDTGQGNNKTEYNIDTSLFADPNVQKKLAPLLQAAGYNWQKPGDVNPSIISDTIKYRFRLRKKEFIEKAAADYNSIRRNAYLFSYIFPNQKHINPKDIYKVFRLLGTLRQTSFHSDDLRNKGTSNRFTLFTIDTQADDEIKDMLNSAVEARLSELNQNFLQKNAVNLNILFCAYPGADRGRLVRQYYDFSIRKTFKNLGFSLKTLRETILETIEPAMEFTDQRYDSVRSKLYSLIDFVIYNYYLSHAEQAQQIVDSLRALMITKEDKEQEMDKVKKEQVYQPAARALWQGIGETVLNVIKPAVSKCRSHRGIEEYEEDVDPSLFAELEPVLLQAGSLNYFAKAIYVISSFLDAKEINMFLDSLINSFDNIESLKASADFMQIPVRFTEQHDFFNHCASFADDLRIVKSVAGMNKSKKAQKNTAVHINPYRYYDCAAMFGEYNQDRVHQMFHLDEKGGSKSRVHTLRNFFINNVIYSNRYAYVIRFVAPESARAIMENHALVSFALQQVDDKQIERYYMSNRKDEDPASAAPDTMRKYLASRLMDVKFDTFAKVSNDSSEAKEKERLKALVGLYLTVIYLITKSLVRINTSYSIAFSIFERDCAIMNAKARQETDPELRALIQNISIKGGGYMGITNYFDAKARQMDEECGYYDRKYNSKHTHRPYTFARLENEIQALLDLKASGDKTASMRAKALCKKYRGRERAKIIYTLNSAHYADSTFRWFRNNVEHLSVVAKLPYYVKDIQHVQSYFDLYHYLLLRCLADGKALWQSATKEKLASALRHQTVYKDFLYGILAPFAYNPARYINLTCKEKFIEGYGK